MLTPQFVLPLHHELVIDLFAGGGGASTGIEQAIGRPVDVAINHDPEAVALHQANHPQTLHLVSDVFEVDPLAVTQGRPVGGLWASPDYIIDRGADGRALTKTAQVRMCGNSVCPPVARALVAANYAEAAAAERRVA